MGDQVIYTPFFLDASISGFEDLIQADWIVNQPELPQGEVQQRMLALYKPLQTAVSEAIAAGKRPVSLAGDCCASLGMLAGLQQAGIRPTLLWFDAHGDFNTWETTPSGFLGGMPLAWLVGRGEQTIPEGLGLRSLEEGKVILTDARDLDPLEAEAVASSTMTHLTEVTDITRSLLPWGPLWVHFDVDVINPVEAPAMNYPAKGGPSVRILGEVFKRLAASRQVKAVSVSLWNPALDADGKTKAAAMKLLRLLLD